MTEPGHLNIHPGLDPEPFSCSLDSIEYADDGVWVSLDRTYYYPQGGDQPADHGTLSSGPVIMDVVDVSGKGGVRHKLQTTDDISELQGTKLLATIDVERRNELCRMHTAQHLISAVADEFWGGRTVGNQIHLQRTRIDLGFDDRDLFNQDQLQEAVNEYVDADLPVTMAFQERSELIENPLVRVNMNMIPQHIENLRVITIDGVDICPCAGTHVNSTSQIGNIVIDKIRSKGSGKLRVEYRLND